MLIVWSEIVLLCRTNHIFCGQKVWYLKVSSGEECSDSLALNGHYASYKRSGNSIVCIFTRLYAGHPRNRGLISGRGQTFISYSQLPDRLWGPPNLRFNGYGSYSGWRVKLTAPLHLLLKLRMSGALSPHPYMTSWRAEG